MSFFFILQREIENIRSFKLQRVFVEFSRHVFSEKMKGNISRTLGDSSIPFYDRMYNIITEDIEKYKLPKPVLFSWMTGDQMKEAEKELKNKPLPDIASIKDCFAQSDYKYPKANFTYFQQLSSMSSDAEVPIEKKKSKEKK